MVSKDTVAVVEQKPIAVYLYVELPRYLKANSFLMLNLSLENILRRVPWFGSMSMRRNIRDFFDSLALLVEAGMPILEALPIATEVIQNQTIRRQFSKIKSRIEEGASFAQAIGELSFVGRAHAYALIQAGEVSGELPEALSTIRIFNRRQSTNSTTKLLSGRPASFIQ